MHCCCLERDDRLYCIDDTSKGSAAKGFGLLERPRISFGSREASRTVRVLVFGLATPASNRMIISFSVNARDRYTLSCLNDKIDSLEISRAPQSLKVGISR